MWVLGKICYYLCNQKSLANLSCFVFSVFFHRVSTLLVSMCSSCESVRHSEAKDKLIPLWNRSLPCMCGSPGYRGYTSYLSPSPQGTIHPQFWHLLCPRCTRPSQQHPNRDIEWNRRQWGQRHPAWAGHITNPGWIDWGRGLCGRGYYCMTVEQWTPCLKSNKEEWKYYVCTG